MNNKIVGIDFFDKHGKKIREFDVLKVFHFTGERNKKHFIYKLVLYNDEGILCIKHLTNDESKLVPLKSVTETIRSEKVFTTAEIVQSASNNL